MVPSSTIAFSEFMLSIQPKKAGAHFCERRRLIQSTCESRRNSASRQKDEDGLRADALRSQLTGGR